MGFAQELKDFTAAFQSGYKAAAPTAGEAALHKEAAEKAERETLLSSAATGRSPAPAVDVTAGSGGTKQAAVDPDRMHAPLTDLEQAIAKVESGRKSYAAMGPVLTKGAYAGDRAYGYTQIMGKNIPEWSEQALGRRLTPQEFLADPEAQKAITRYKLQELWRKYRNPDDVASAWFSGGPLRERASRQDQLGTTVPAYVGKVRRAMGRTAALDLDEEVPTVFAASGGLVPDLDTGHDDDAGSNPAVREARERSSTAQVDPGIIPEMFDSGLKYLEKTLGLGGTAVPEASPRTSEAARALALNVGAPRPEQVAELVRAVDPDGKLPRDQQLMAGWSAYYDHYSKKGDLDKAARGAAAMLMYSKQVSQRAGALALAALEKGDVQGAANAMKAAYDYIPDGVAVRVKTAGPGGVEYEQVDLRGDKPVLGKATVEELRGIAQGMMDGSQWFQAVNAARLPVDKAAQRQAAESKAAAEFEGTLTPEQLDDYRATLTPEQLEKFNKLPRQKQQQYLNAFRTDRRAAFDEFKFNERMARAVETGDRKEALDLFKFAARYGMWEKTREQVLTENEKRLAQKELEEEGRNRRQQMSFEEQRRRQREVDERILGKRTKGLDGAGVKLTPKEAADARRATAEEEAAKGREQARATAILGDTADTEIGDAQRSALDLSRGAQRAGMGYARTPPAERKIDDEAVGQIEEIMASDPQWKEKGFAPADVLWARKIASEIKAAGGPMVTVKEAADVVKSALGPGPDPVVLPGGLVRIGHLPPVKMSEQALLQLAMMRERMRAKPAAGADGQPRSALKLTPAQERRQQREEATRKEETARASALQLEKEARTAPGSEAFEKLKRELGADWRPDMTYPEMKRALADLRRERATDPARRRQVRMPWEHSYRPR